VTHVEGDVNPVRDLEIINEELRLKDEEYLLATLDKMERTVIRGNDKKGKPEYDCLVKVKEVLVTEKQHIRFADWSAADVSSQHTCILRLAVPSNLLLQQYSAIPSVFFFVFFF